MIEDPRKEFEGTRTCRVCGENFGSDQNSINSCIIKPHTQFNKSTNQYDCCKSNQRTNGCITGFHYIKS